MVYCTKCGTQFEGKFCPNCGAAVNGTVNTTPPIGVGPPRVGLSSNWASVVCYLVPIAGPLIFLFLAPYNRDPRIRFNGWQALFLQLAWMAAHVVVNIFHEISWSLTNALHQMVGLVYFVRVSPV